MSTAIESYTVTLPDETTVTVTAQSFEISQGAIRFFSQTSQTVAAFAGGAWLQVTPVVTP